MERFINCSTVLFYWDDKMYDALKKFGTACTDIIAGGLYILCCRKHSESVLEDGTLHHEPQSSIPPSLLEAKLAGENCQKPATPPQTGKEAVVNWYSHLKP